MALGFPCYHCPCFGSMGGEQKVNFSCEFLIIHQPFSPYTCTLGWVASWTAMQEIQKERDWNLAAPFVPACMTSGCWGDCSRYRTMRGRCLETVWSPLRMTVRTCLYLYVLSYAFRIIRWRSICKRGNSLIHRLRIMIIYWNCFKIFMSRCWLKYIMFSGLGVIVVVIDLNIF